MYGACFLLLPPPLSKMQAGGELHVWSTGGGGEGTQTVPEQSQFLINPKKAAVCLSA